MKTLFQSTGPDTSICIEANDEGEDFHLTMWAHSSVKSVGLTLEREHIVLLLNSLTNHLANTEACPPEPSDAKLDAIAQLDANHRALIDATQTRFLAIENRVSEHTNRLADFSNVLARLDAIEKARCPTCKQHL